MPQEDERMEICYIYTMEYYSPIKKNEILIHASVWTDLENIMLNKRSPS